MQARTSRLVATLTIAFALSTLALSACAGSDARAQKIAQKAKDRFAAADTNHDGQLSQDEANQGMPRLATHFGAGAGVARGRGGQRSRVRPVPSDDAGVSFGRDLPDL